MTCGTLFSIAQGFAQNWPQCSARHQDAPPPVAWRQQSEAFQYQQSALSHYQNATLSDDSDQSSQTSFQDSASDASDGTYSSPPSSTSSDDGHACDTQADTHQQFTTVQSVHSQSDRSTPTQQSRCDVTQNIANITFRPKYGIPSLEHKASPLDVNSNSSTLTGLLSDLDRNPPPPSGGAQPSRRRGCSATDVVPKLKRDTDNTDAIVKMIVVFCTNLINSIWCPRALNEGNLTTSPAGGVLPLQVFITETLRRSKTSYSTLQVALYYLILLKQCLPSLSANGQSGQSGCRAMQCGRRMFLTALILASKYLQDRNYSARAWSKISGLPLKEINDNERRYLSIVCWDLHVPKDTFENWSKIVLAVCRLSNERDASGFGFERRPPGSGSGPAFAKQVQLQDMCNDGVAVKSWWLHHLGLLRTDIVRCPRKTDAYLHSISPFKQVMPINPPVLFDGIARSYSPESTCSGEREDTPKSVPKLPSIEKLTQIQQFVERSGSPATVYTLPPPPMLRNLPTPQTTPRSEMTNLWAGSVHKQGPRCRASLSALRNIDKACLPFANLETCPPPPPRSSAGLSSTGCPLKDKFQAWRSKASTPSITSSPESVMSDFSSITPRSRSSSISSATSLLSSGANTPVQNHDSKLQRDMASLQQKLAAQRIPSMMRRQQLGDLRACYSRPQTAFKAPPNDDDGYDTASDTFSQSSQCSRGSDEGYISDDLLTQKAEQRREAEAAEALLAFQHQKPFRTPTQRSFSTQRSDIDLSSANLLKHSSSQLLKRSRSESLDATHLHERSELFYDPANQVVDQETVFGQQTDGHFEKQIHQPAMCWATPRKPIQCRAQNKRLAIQLPHQASSLASEYLKTSLVAS